MSSSAVPPPSSIVSLSPLDKLQAKNISESTFNLYRKNLLKLNGNKEIKSLNFLKNVDKVLEKISHLKPNTRRTYVISIVSLLKQEPTLKKLYSKYYKVLMEYNASLKTNNQMSEREKENWLSQEEVQKTFDALQNESQPLLHMKKLNREEYEKIQSFVILALYVLNPPRRNMDYQLMRVVPKVVNDMDKSANYLDMGLKQFVFNNYKTKKTYQSQVVPIPDKLYDIIQSFLKLHPNTKELAKKKFSVPLLTTYDGQHFTSINAITRVLHKVFKKKLGSSMLRHIYLTEKYGSENNALQSDAEAMGTSVPTIQNQYIKQEII